jgi:hypothetical protein
MMDREILIRIESTVSKEGTRNNASGIVEMKGDTVDLIMTLVACMRGYDDLRVVVQAAAVMYGGGMGPDMESVYELKT